MVKKLNLHLADFTIFFFLLGYMTWEKGAKKTP